MRSAILLVLILLLSFITVASAQSSSNEVSGNYVSYIENGNSIHNFSVVVDGTPVNVFTYLNFSSLHFFMSNFSGEFKIMDNILTPIIFTGIGEVNAEINSNMDLQIFSTSNNVYIKITNESYEGIIISDGSLNVNENNLTLSGNFPFYFLFMTLPISYYLYSSNNSQPGIITGTYLEMKNGISDYSLVSSNSTVEVIKSIIPFKLYNNETEIGDTIFFKNGTSPSIIGSGSLYGYNITLSEPFSFKEISQNTIVNFSIPSIFARIIMNVPEEQTVYNIYYNNYTVGSVMVFGYSYVNNNSLIIPSNLSSFVVHFKPVIYSGVNDNIIPITGNISLEIFDNNSSYFVPISPYVQVISLNETGNSVFATLYQYHNSTIEFFIPPGYKISSITMNGMDLTYGNQTNGFTVTRVGNQSVALINLNETGKVAMAISTSKFSGYHRVPLFTVFLITSIILVVAALGLILYARKKSMMIYEKNI